ncbi:hypothetical protein WI665_10060, partial [Vibrio cholerae]
MQQQHIVFEIDENDVDRCCWMLNGGLCVMDQTSWLGMAPITPAPVTTTVLQAIGRTVSRRQDKLDWL